MHANTSSKWPSYGSDLLGFVVFWIVISAVATVYLIRTGVPLVPGEYLSTLRAYAIILGLIGLLFMIGQFLGFTFALRRRSCRPALSFDVGGLAALACMFLLPVTALVLQAIFGHTNVLPRSLENALLAIGIWLDIAVHCIVWTICLLTAGFVIAFILTRLLTRPLAASQ
jgi:hypothetical protein